MRYTVFAAATHQMIFIISDCRLFFRSRQRKCLPAEMPSINVYQRVNLGPPQERDQKTVNSNIGLRGNPSNRLFYSGARFTRQIHIYSTFSDLQHLILTWKRFHCFIVFFFQVSVFVSVVTKGYKQLSATVVIKSH